MDRQSWKEFYKWLDSASDDEMLEKQDKLAQLRDRVAYDTDVVSDIDRMVRQISEELVTRTILS